MSPPPFLPSSFCFSLSALISDSYPTKLYRLLEIDLARGNTEVIRADLQLAVDANPTSSILWSSYVEFERAQEEAGNIGEVQRSAAAKGVVIPTTPDNPLIL